MVGSRFVSNSAIVFFPKKRDLPFFANTFALSFAGLQETSKEAFESCLETLGSDGVKDWGTSEEALGFVAGRAPPVCLFFLFALKISKTKQVSNPP